MDEPKRVTATEARVRFGEVMRHAQERGPVVVERHGEPAVVVVSAAEWERGQECTRPNPLRDAVEECRALRAELRAKYGPRQLPHPADVVREGREERARQLEEAGGLRRREPVDSPGD